MADDEVNFIAQLTQRIDNLDIENNQLKEECSILRGRTQDLETRLRLRDNQPGQTWQEKCEDLKGVLQKFTDAIKQHLIDGNTGGLALNEYFNLLLEEAGADDSGSFIPPYESLTMRTKTLTIETPTARRSPSVDSLYSYPTKDGGEGKRKERHVTQADYDNLVQGIQNALAIKEGEKQLRAQLIDILQSVRISSHSTSDLSGWTLLETSQAEERDEDEFVADEWINDLDEVFADARSDEDDEEKFPSQPASESENDKVDGADMQEATKHEEDAAAKKDNEHEEGAAAKKDNKHEEHGPYGEKEHENEGDAVGSQEDKENEGDGSGAQK